MTRYYRYDGLAPVGLVPVPCAVCASDAADLIGIDNGFRVCRCRECGFVHVNPRPSAEQLRDFYARFYDDADAVPDKWEREMGDLFDECCGWLTARYPRGSVLDVGCSFGHFLQRMERHGWSTTGIEPSPVAARYAAQLLRGTVHQAGFENVALAAGEFDAVVSLYVLEHVSDPRGFVEKVHQVLKLGGLAIIRIPYTKPIMPLNRLLRRPLMYAPMHLNDFSPRSMRRLALDLGFRDVDVRVGCARRAHDPAENIGARVLGGIGRTVEKATARRVLFPWVGALSYLLHK